METVFWASSLFVLYVYAGYPLLLGLWSRAAGRPSRRAPHTAQSWPTLSVVIAARNEAHRLPRRINNLLEQSYPHPIEIIVVSDGSTDGTRDAIAPFSERVRFIDLPRGGKPRALNAGVAAAHGDVIVFADARQRFAPGALQALASNFDDPAIGGATGELILDGELHGVSESTVADGVGLYWKYEKWMRRHESRLWSTLGATGAIYAMRRALYRPLPADTILDDVLTPMRLVLDGGRVVFSERAFAFDCAAVDAEAEQRRKVRTLAGNVQILGLEPRLLVPFVNPVWAQYASHKVGRLVVPYALLALFTASLALAGQHPMYTAALFAQTVLYLLGGYGAWLDFQTSRLRRPAATATGVVSERIANA